MLAYDLYLRNKDSSTNVVKLQKPLKKIFVKNNQVAIDSTTLEEYGSGKSEKFRILQESMTMPLNTSDFSLLNLPDFRTSNSQPNPYVEIYGTLKVKKLEPVLSLRIQGRKLPTKEKREILEAFYEISRDNISVIGDKDIELKIERKNYFMSKEALFEKYVESGILKKDGFFSSTLFKEIVNKFFRYARKIEMKPEKDMQLPFSVFVLPSASKIEFQGKAKIEDSNSFTDSFGNSASSYASESTKTAKFLSFDDKAFTINCKKNEGFYENLGIGSESLRCVYLPADQVFRIAGLNWMFTNLSDPYYKFKETSRGIFSQLYENYEKINSSGQTKRERALLKVVCFRTQQAKQEILIDDNLTMDRMKGLFSRCDIKSVPALAFEELIEKMDKNTLWNNYVYAIRSFLSQSNVPKSYLIALFNKFLRRHIYDWLKQKGEGKAIIFSREQTFV